VLAAPRQPRESRGGQEGDGGRGGSIQTGQRRARKDDEIENLAADGRRSQRIREESAEFRPRRDASATSGSSRRFSLGSSRARVDSRDE